MTACPRCQEALPDGVRFCTQCGSPASPLSPVSPLSPLSASRKGGGPLPDLPPRYEVVKFLGRGGMGRVFLCKDTRLQVEVAIKVLPPEVAADEESLAQIEREARAAAKFRDCSGILSLYGFEQHNDTWYLVMEFAAGGSLYDRLKKEGALPEADCRRLAAEVAESLAFAHDRRILHRDIKPANVLLDADGRTKIADFGIAKVMSETSSRMSSVTVAGTPIYMAPEIVLQKKVDHRTDLYSLGCMLYEMATGVRPFGGSYAEVAMAKVGPDSRAPDPRNARPGLSDELASIIQCLLCPDPEGRYSNGRECAAALRGQPIAPDLVGTPAPFATGGAGPETAGSRSGTTVTGPRHPVPGVRRRKPVAWILGGVALAAAAAVAGFLLFGGSGGKAAPAGASAPPKTPDQAAAPSGGGGVEGPAASNPGPAPSQPPPSPSPRVVAADLVVSTSPPGGRVSVDGKHRSVAGEKGLKVAGLDPAASHIVAATLEGYDTAEATVEPWSGKGEWTALLVLTRQQGTLEVLEVPPGTEITARPATGSAVRITASGGRATRDLDTGECEVLITVSGGQPVSEKVVVRKGETATVRVKARPVGGATLTIETDTAGAEVFVDGKRIGVTPLKDVPVLSGPHTVQVLHPDRDPLPPFEVRIEDGEKKVVPVALTGAELDLSALPEGTTALLDGKPVTGVVRTRSGTAEVVLSRPGYRDQSLKVNLRGSQKVSVPAGDWVLATGAIDLSALPADAAVTVDGNPANRGAGPLALPPGSHVVAVRRPGFQDPAPRTVEVKAGETVALESPAWVSVLAPVVPGLPDPPATGIPNGPLPQGARLLDGRLVWEKDRAEMVLVPLGIYSMGSDKGDSNARPMHTVSVHAFLMDRHEVTNAQFQAFVRATGYRTDAEKKGSAIAVDDRVNAQEVKGADWVHPQGPASSLEGRERSPVLCVSWNDADAYATWAGKRLPTEAEFERALRGQMFQKEYPWGDAAVPDRKVANLADEAAKKANAGVTAKFAAIAGYDDGFAGPAPAGSFPPNPFGLVDIVGNALEWCRDYYDEKYYSTLPVRGPNPNPGGPGTGAARVARGGSFYNAPAKARSSFREGYAPDACLGFLGFRCVVPLPR